MSFASDLLVLGLFCSVLLVAARAGWAYVNDRPLAPPTVRHAAADAGTAAIDSPAFQRRMMRFARATARSFGRGASHRLEYTTPAGTAFAFTLRRQSSADWRIYIESQPGYRGRPDGGHDTHRYVDDAGRHYICWDGAIRGADQAVFIAARWALLTERYIAHGRHF